MGNDLKDFNKVILLSKMSSKLNFQFDEIITVVLC